MRKHIAICLAGLCASSVAAQESTTYQYDALGRLISADARIGANGGRRHEYSFDKASNRARVQNVVIVRTGQLPVEASLQRGQGMRSPDGKYVLYMQQDGNLVVYDRNTVATWNSTTFDRSQLYLIMQGDGNLVIYTGSGQPIWHTNTWGNPGAYAELTNDGKLRVRKPDGTQLWSS